MPRLLAATTNVVVRQIGPTLLSGAVSRRRGDVRDIKGLRPTIIVTKGPELEFDVVRTYVRHASFRLRLRLTQKLRRLRHTFGAFSVVKRPRQTLINLSFYEAQVVMSLPGIGRLGAFLRTCRRIRLQVVLPHPLPHILTFYQTRPNFRPTKTLIRTSSSRAKTTTKIPTPTNYLKIC